MPLHGRLNADKHRKCDNADFREASFCLGEVSKIDAQSIPAHCVARPPLSLGHNLGRLGG
jgi:hypothetical protein